MDKVLLGLLVGLTLMAGGCAQRGPDARSQVLRPLMAEAPEAGILAIAVPASGTVRVLYARNGGMVLVRELRVPAGAVVRDLSLSADGADLIIATEAAAYVASTRTGRMEPLAMAAGATFPAGWPSQERGLPARASFQAGAADIPATSPARSGAAPAEAS